ncbi:exonuclease domain-containing protein [Aeromicrobium phragmitis]|nr:exonuclease domain-containing protein [Aeromicrobium phragmitis]
MSTWTRGTVYAFDTETTGVDVHHDRIVTATVVKIVAGQLTDQRSWLINPGVEIPETATAVHGITTEHARENGTAPIIALPEIADVVAGVLRARLPLVAFNAAFDLSILEAELARHDIPTIASRVEAAQWHTLVDPFVLGRGIDNINKAYRKGRKYKLPDLCQRYGVPFTETHDATTDAVGAALLAIAIVEAEEYFAEHGPERLFKFQQTSRRADQRRFRQWVVDNGRTEEYGDIDDGWPLHSRLHQGVLA